MTMSGFRAQPHHGHLDHVKRIYGYLYKMKDAKIVICTEEPDYSDIPINEYEWSHSVYGDVKELTPKDAPEPLGKFVMLSHYVNANLFHDMVTGHLIMGILHFLNKMPINQYAKKQATVETATYGSEYVMAHTCVNQVVDLRLTHHYLGIPIQEKSYMFGNNKTVIDSSSKPHSKLHKMPQHIVISPCV